uniref:DUF5681 domain-containing protein n=1 Tax=viral metagenome TaxID=1070528 RepID=A0A6M3JXB4_9ZZZZ
MKPDKHGKKQGKRALPKAFKESQWGKGQSGNPKGRPVKGDCLTSLLKDEIEKICPDDKDGKTWKELIVIATMRLAIEGNKAALKEVWERVDGKVPQAITGKDGGPLEATVSLLDLVKRANGGGSPDGGSEVPE